MWKPFKSGENLYLLNLEEKDEQFKVCVTDLLELWQAELSLEDLVRNFKERNPLIEATPLIVRDNVLDLIENVSNYEISVNVTEDHLDLTIKQKCEELASQDIIYDFTLKKDNQTEFKSKITVPMIQTIHLLEEQQKIFLTLIKKKDRELQEYHMEKGEISRGDLKTEPFNPETVCAENSKLFLNTFLETNFKQFWEKFKEENGEIKTTTLSVGTEPWNQVKKRKKVYNSKTAIKKGSGITYASQK